MKRINTKLVNWDRDIEVPFGTLSEENGRLIHELSRDLPLGWDDFYPQCFPSEYGIHRVTKRDSNPKRGAGEAPWVLTSVVEEWRPVYPNWPRDRASVTIPWWKAKGFVASLAGEALYPGLPAEVRVMFRGGPPPRHTQLEYGRYNNRPDRRFIDGVTAVYTATGGWEDREEGISFLKGDILTILEHTYCSQLVEDKPTTKRYVFYFE